MDDSLIDVSPRGCAAKCLWTFRPTTMGQNVYGRIAHGVKRLVLGETSVGRIAHRVNCQWGKLSVGELSVGRKVLTLGQCVPQKTTFVDN